MRQTWLAVVAGLVVAVATEAQDTGKAIKPFNGKDLAGWKTKKPEGSKWKVGSATLDEKNPTKFTFSPSPAAMPELVNTESGGVDVYSEAQFGDAIIEVEFMVPKGSNSGIYVMGEYEIQILDSYGREKIGMGDLGAIYSASVPKMNAAKKPGEWQKFVIDFQAPRFADGKKTANAKFLKVTLNDQVIHENVEMKGPTPGGVTNKEAATGPLMFQGDHGPVSYRNIKITPK